MNNRQKIIVSVTGIFIVLLILVGLTYAYYLTSITGNPNTTSINVTTENLELVYGDGTVNILKNNTPVIPSSEPIGTKDFTVTNNGDTTDYVVVFEDITVKYAKDKVIDGVNIVGGSETTFISNDFIYTLTCKKKDNTSCNGVTNEVFPMDGGIVVGNNIDKGDVHTYTLTLYYLETGEDQTGDMNKLLNGKVNIKDIKTINPYSENKSSLAYNIINNSILNKNGTELLSVPLTKPAEEINLETEKVLSVTKDDHGDSYYYRGNVKDNYVTFAGMCWRIVRIQGDGSTKLILEDQDEPCSTSINGNWAIPTETGGTTYTGNHGYEDKNVDEDSSIEHIMSYLKPVTNANKSMVKAFYNFQTALAKKINTNLNDTSSETEINNALLSKLKSGDWCLGDKAYTYSAESGYTLLEQYDYSRNMFYDSYVRLYGKTPKEPTLKCNGTILNEFATVSGVSNEVPMYVSAITADEVVFSGGKTNTNNQNYYLINEEFKKGSSGANKSNTFWSLSPNRYGAGTEAGDYAYDVNFYGNLNGATESFKYAFRPAVSLSSNAVITEGVGTLEKPYVIG